MCAIYERPLRRLCSILTLLPHNECDYQEVTSEEQREEWPVWAGYPQLRLARQPRVHKLFLNIRCFQQRGQIQSLITSFIIDFQT